MGFFLPLLLHAGTSLMLRESAYHKYLLISCLQEIVVCPLI